MRHAYRRRRKQIASISRYFTTAARRWLTRREHGIMGLRAA